MSFKNKKEERNVILADLVEQYPVLYDYEHPAYCNRYIQDEAWRAIADLFQESVPNCKENWRSLRNCFARDLRHMTTNPNGYTKKRPYYMSEFMQFLVPYLPIAQRRNHAILSGTAAPEEFDIDRVPHAVHALDQSTEDSQSIEDDTEDLSRAIAEDIVQKIKKEEIKTEPDLYWSSPSDLNGHSSTGTLDIMDGSNVSPKQIPVSSSAKRLKTNLSTGKRKCNGTNPVQKSDPDMDFLKSLLPDIKKLPNNKKLIFKIKNLELLNELLYDQSCDKNI